MRPRWKAVAIASTLATLSLTAVGVAISDPDRGDRPAAIVDDPGIDPLDERRARTVPVAVEPRAEHGCGGLPRAFDNDVAGYSLCYPGDWGFLRLTDPNRAATLDGLEAASVRLASPPTFPWKPGRPMLDAIRGGAAIVEIVTLPSYEPPPDEDCVPRDGLVRGAKACTARIDPMSLATQAGGPVLEVLSIHEWPSRTVVARSYLAAGATQLDDVIAILETLRSIEVAR